MEQLTKNQAVATSQEAVQNQNEPQLRDENAHNDKSVQDRKSGSAGMPRPISYAVFCLKKKKITRTKDQEIPKNDATQIETKITWKWTSTLQTESISPTHTHVI